MSTKVTALESKLEQQRFTSRVWRQLLVATIAGIMASQTIGCCGTGGCGLNPSGLLDNQISCYRDKVWAKRAFNLRYGNCDRKFGDHFRNGFIDGYCSICDGGEGYVPAMPPECYWGNEFQCAEGAQCVNAWFEGYPAGAVAARKDGAGSFRDVYISKMINSAIVQDKKKDAKVNTAQRQAISPTSMQPPIPTKDVPRPLSAVPTVIEAGMTSVPSQTILPAPIQTAMPMDTNASTALAPERQLPQAIHASQISLPMPMSMPLPMNGVQQASYVNGN